MAISILYFWPGKAHNNDMVNERLFERLEARRKKLGMSHAILAAKSRVSMRTVVRVLSGRHPQVSLENAVAIAQALGLNVAMEEQVGVDELLERRAKEKAAQIVRMVQATSGLEGQAVSREEFERMSRRTVHELLAGSRRNLWSD
jgi:transcriptional regulator with XRE-family HTH domain